jgi:phosphomannomutase
MQQPLSRIIAGIKKYESSGEINFRITHKQEAMDALRDFFTSAETPAAQYDFDGYRVEFPEWWFNVRPSNTEPYLRFIAEASDAGLLEEKLSAMRRVLQPFIDV